MDSNNLWRKCRTLVGGIGVAFAGLAMSAPQIRVALWKGEEKITVSGPSLVFQFSDPRFETLYPDETVITLAGSAEGFQMGRNFFPQHIVTIRSKEASPLTLGGKQFRGSIEVQRNDQGKLLVINEIPLEDYLVGLVQSEIASTWPAEALKAQAVAARTYALYRQKQRQGVKSLYDLESTTDDQVYNGLKPNDASVTEAVRQTQGEVLWYFGYFPAYFHSCCGGMTEVTSHVWNKKDVSVSVVDPFCQRAPYFHWEYRISNFDLLKILKQQGLEGKRIVHGTPTPFDNTPRAETVEIKTDLSTLYVRATDLRNWMGTQQLRSTWFEAAVGPRETVFRGLGYGHGVGLCQWGAKGMSEVGKSYKDILKFYYPKAEMRKMY